VRLGRRALAVVRARFRNLKKRGTSTEPGNPGGESTKAHPVRFVLPGRRRVVPRIGGPSRRCARRRVSNGAGKAAAHALTYFSRRASRKWGLLIACLAFLVTPLKGPLSEIKKMWARRYIGWREMDLASDSQRLVLSDGPSPGSLPVRPTAYSWASLESRTK
jgi:hypothetical protein